MTTEPDGASDEDATRLSMRRDVRSTDVPEDESADDDATRLASRRTAADDVDDATRLTTRRAPVEEVDDATRLSTRRSPEDLDDATRMVIRRRAAGNAVPAPPVADDDATVLSASRGSVAPAPDNDDRTRVVSQRPRRPSEAALPPGAPLGEAPRQGAFGDVGDIYTPRATPEVEPPAPLGAASAPSTDAAAHVLSPTEVAARRARERRGRLVIGVVLAAAGAALLTAVIVVAVTLVSGS
ncbi:hypothetical protein [Demequina litorisediminis]|uniref:Uncharacterized protein n=1 Tax=Demequina litorisediminis TaxID=1849022 RepID=A0ABQ6IEL1_9MICO|nr:hypothetical protein [Demequina litorisediminis]GMA35548.1 hypothetical protein GCM10025876_17520 [Demequina litorisediminis]